MSDKDSKIWELLGVWQNIEPRPGYIERFKERLAQRKHWHERFWDTVKEQFSFRQPVFQTVMSLGVILLMFISGQTYNNYALTKSLLSNVSEQQWEMLANYETVSQMDVVKDL